MSTLNYNALEKMTHEHQWWFSPSELHGILTALCVSKCTNDWQKILALTADPTAVQLLPALISHIESELKDNNLSYQLLLADDSNLSQRAETLAQWSQGFILATNYLRETQQLPKWDDASHDFIHDVSEISSLDTQLSDNEDNRHHLMTLEEHCRMGALMLFAATKPT